MCVCVHVCGMMGKSGSWHLSSLLYREAVQGPTARGLSEGSAQFPRSRVNSDDDALMVVPGPGPGPGLVSGGRLGKRGGWVCAARPRTVRRNQP